MYCTLYVPSNAEDDDGDDDDDDDDVVVVVVLCPSIETFTFLVGLMFILHHSSVYHIHNCQ